MTDIRTADFCDQYGYTQAQITYAIKTGKLIPIKRGVIDEELSLQALSKVKPAKAKTQSDQDRIISDLQNEIQMLREELQSTIELNNLYKAELNQLGHPVLKPKFSIKELLENQKRLTRHPFMSQEWLKESFLPQPNPESLNKPQKVQIPAECLKSDED